MAVDQDARDAAYGAATKAIALSKRLGRRIRIAAPQMAAYPINTQLSDGATQLTGTDRIPYLLNSDYAWLSAVMMNGYPQSGTGRLVPTGNSVTIRVGFEQGGTTTPKVMPFRSPTLTPISSGGKSGHVIGDGEIQISDPCYRGIMAKGSYQFLRIYKSVTAGQKWPLTYGKGMYDAIDATPTSGNSGTTDQLYGNSVKTGADFTYTGSVAFGTWANGSSLYWAPIFIIGEQITPAPVVLVTGDSVSAGFGDTNGRGYIIRALEAAGIGYGNGGVPASKASDSVGNHDVSRKAIDFVDYAIIHTMSNSFAQLEVTTLDAAKAMLLQVAQTYCKAHTKVIFATVLPRCATTDAGATYPNQTKPAWEALRISYNNWLRDKTSNGAVAWLNARLLVGSVQEVIDPCIQVERDYNTGTTAVSAITLDANGQQAVGNGGYFLAGGSTDCTHPNAALCAVAAASVPVSRITLPDA